jgi:hypothetical protein
MANSVKPGPLGAHHHHHPRRRPAHPGQVPPKAATPGRTPGALGHQDQGDPSITTLLGWAPGVTGLLDWADHTLHTIEDRGRRALGSVGRDAAGAPVAVGSTPAARAGDLDLGFLGDYAGGEISKADIEAAAKDLGCEPGLIYAIAKQESARSSFIQLQGRTVPSILYERHIFRKLTRPNERSPSPYEADHHDICGPAYHRTEKQTSTVTGKDGHKHVVAKVVDKVTHESPVADDVYGPGGEAQYRRLVKAYALDASAALQSCSWGKFQIMGFNYQAAGYPDVFAFMRAMCSGDPAHIKAFLKFARSNAVLLGGLRNKDYEAIARGHNGDGWRGLNPEYASNIERFSKEYK